MKVLWFVNLSPPTYLPRNKALLTIGVSLNKALLNPYFWGEYVGEG